MRAIVLIVGLMLITSPSVAEKPNIILVMADDQGWGDVAYNGHPHLQTPNLDTAAAEGLRFDRFYAAAPVCSPTRGSVLTGRHPNRYGVFNWGHPIRPQEVTIAEALKTVGYATGHFGKWHLGSVRAKSAANPGASGFDEWLSAPNYYDNHPTLSHRGRAQKIRGESSIVTVDAALDWIGKQAEVEQPFLAVVWFGSPHTPHFAYNNFLRPYAGQSKIIRDFYGEIAGMDHAFGKIRNALDDMGIRDNTVLWYTSDNGAQRRVGHNGGYRGLKGAIYDGGLLVPAIVEWPSHIKSHRVTDIRCSTADIYPTLLDIVGVTVENQPPVDGVSLLPLIEGEWLKRPEPMGFWQYPAPGIVMESKPLMSELLAAQEAGEDLEPDESSQTVAELPNPPHALDRFPGHAAWIDKDWKLHRIEDRRNGEVRWELYNLEADPKEKTDLLLSESTRVDSLRDRLESWLGSVVRSLNGEDYRSP